MTPRLARRRSCSARGSAGGSGSGSAFPRGLLLLALLGLCRCTCADLAGPGAQLNQAARDLETTQALPASGLNITKLGVSRITPEPELHPPRVTFSFDVEGALPRAALPDDPPVLVSALGAERVPMVYASGSWRPVASPLPMLDATLAHLRPGLAKDRAVLRLLIRVDVRRVDVTEELGSGQRQSLRLAPLSDGGLQDLE